MTGDGEPRLLDLRMADGSRHFGDVTSVRGIADVAVLRAAIETLPGARLGACVDDGLDEAWLDFTWAGESFSLNLQCGDWWCFVQRPAASDGLLREVVIRLAAALAAR